MPRWCAVRQRSKSAVTVGLFVVSAAARPDVAVGLVILAVVFVPIERLIPVARSRTLRRGWSCDVVHFVVDQVVGGALVTLMAIALVPMLEPLLPNLDTLVAGPTRLIAAAVIGELFGYWGHRLMHRVPFLWRLHSVHHSSTTMDWLAPNRRHVLDTALGQAASVIPLLALGLAPPVVVGWFVIRRAQGLFVHANIRVHLPVIRWLVATPEFHHWHHSADPDRYDQNFAGQSPIVDWLFGTLYMPVRAWPSSYGLSLVEPFDPVPSRYLDRLMWPLRGPGSAGPGLGGLGSAGVRSIRAKRVWICAAFGLIVGVGGAGYVAARPRGPIPWRFNCSVTDSAGGIIEISTGPLGVMLTSWDGKPDRTNVRAISGDPTHGLGIRVVRRGSVPATVRIDPVSSGRSGAELVGPEGVARGHCRLVDVTEGAAP